MGKLPKLLSAEEIQKALAKLPAEVKLDLLQLGLDLVGLVNPAADAASAGLSLWRGDYLGAAISAVSIIPLGDVLKVARLGKYAKTLEALVTRVAPQNPALYKELAPFMEQLRTVLAKVPAGHDAVDRTRDLVGRFFRNAELYRLTSGVKTLEGWASFARQRGRWKGGAYAKAGTTPADVVDRLLSAAQDGHHVSLRLNAKELIRQMGQKDWVIAAGPHKTTAAVGGFRDRTPHMTLEVAGQPYEYHVRLDAKGNVWEIRTMQRINGKLQAVNPVAGTPRPWQGPGQ